MCRAPRNSTKMSTRCAPAAESVFKLWLRIYIHNENRSDRVLRTDRVSGLATSLPFARVAGVDSSSSRPVADDCFLRRCARMQQRITYPRPATTGASARSSQRSTGDMVIRSPPHPRFRFLILCVTTSIFVLFPDRRRSSRRDPLRYFPLRARCVAGGR